MKITVNSATLERYNANNRGKNVGDCVKRSMSIAFDLPYSEIAKLLNAKKHELHTTSAWNSVRVFPKVINDLGGSDFVIMHPENVTTEEYADNYAEPGKTYLLLTGKKYGEHTHLVCIRDQKIWDSWDSRNYIVSEVSTIGDTVKHKDITDIKDHLKELAHDYVTPTLTNELKRLMNKKDWEGSYEYSCSEKNYALVTRWTLTLYPDGLLVKNRKYTFEIILPLEPTMTIDDAIKFIQTTGKQRMYDRIYAINDQEKKLIEEAEVREQLHKDGADAAVDYWMNDRETRFYRSLPGWSRALITYIDIQNPGQYSDSYTIQMIKLPGDTLHPDIERFHMYGYESSDIIYQLNRYKKSYEIAGIDYEPDW